MPKRAPASKRESIDRCQFQARWVKKLSAIESAVTRNAVNCRVSATSILIPYFFLFSSFFFLFLFIRTKAIDDGLFPTSVDPRRPARLESTMINRHARRSAALSSQPSFARIAIFPFSRG